jgi:hypothetical protein
VHYSLRSALGQELGCGTLPYAPQQSLDLGLLLPTAGRYYLLLEAAKAHAQLKLQRE